MGMNILNIFAAMVGFLVSALLIWGLWTPVTTFIDLMAGTDTTLSTFMTVGWWMVIIIMQFAIPIYLALTDDIPNMVGGG